MRINNDVASRLRALREGDFLEINGDRYAVASKEEVLAGEDPVGERDVKEEGVFLELRKRGSDAFAPAFRLSFMDIEVRYALEAVLDGPAPLNPFPDIIFVQDFENSRTYKYRISKHQKDVIELRFCVGDEGIIVKSLIFQG